jgi:hypothetical protein
MIVLVCGGRGFGVVPEGLEIQGAFFLDKADGERSMMSAVLDRFHLGLRFARLIHGDASGADRLSGEWAQSRGIPVRAFPADWAKHRRAAGPIRNKQMLEEGHPDLSLPSPVGEGRPTWSVSRKRPASRSSK